MSADVATKGAPHANLKRTATSGAALKNSGLVDVLKKGIDVPMALLDFSIGQAGQAANSVDTELFDHLTAMPGQGRRALTRFFSRKSRRRVQQVSALFKQQVEPSIFDSRLQESLHLLRGLATNIGQDKASERTRERLEAIRRVIELLQVPASELHGIDPMNGSSFLRTDSALAADPLMQEFLGEELAAPAASADNSAPAHGMRTGLAAIAAEASAGRAPLKRTNSRNLAARAKRFEEEKRRKAKSASNLSVRVAADPKTPMWEDEYASVPPSPPDSFREDDADRSAERVASLSKADPGGWLWQTLQTPTVGLSTLIDSGVVEWSAPYFDALELQQVTNGHGLEALGWRMHYEQGWEHGNLALPLVAWEKFCAGVQAGYHDVPYHNAAHAVDVAHGVYHLLVNVPGLHGAGEEPAMLFAAVVAGMVHDLGHDGTTNGWHVNMGDEAALLYSDHSVLEMRSLTAAFRIIDESGLLENFSMRTRRAVRKRIIAMVLATDFAQHTTVVNDFKLLTESVPVAAARGNTRGTTGKKRVWPSLSRLQPPRTHADAEARSAPVFSSSASTMNAAEQQLVACMVIKAADLSHMVKGKRNALDWTDRWLEELFELGDKEEDAGLHARDGHHRSGYDRASHDVPTSQLSMLILLVKPLFDAIHRLAPMTKQLEHVHELIEHWRKEASFSVS